MRLHLLVGLLPDVKRFVDVFAAQLERGFSTALFDGAICVFRLRLYLAGRTTANVDSYVQNWLPDGVRQTHWPSSWDRKRHARQLLDEALASIS